MCTSPHKIKQFSTHHTPDAIMHGLFLSRKRKSERKGSAAAETAEKFARKKSLHLGTLRYVNYNSSTDTCSLNRVLDAARESGKPIFAHFVNAKSSGDSNVVSKIFSDTHLNRVVEECFIPAVFNIEKCHDSAHMKFIQKWFGGMVPRSDKDFLRIVTSDGKRVIMLSDDVATDAMILEPMIVHALVELHRHVPETAYRSVRKPKICFTTRLQL